MFARVIDLYLRIFKVHWLLLYKMSSHLFCFLPLGMSDYPDGHFDI